MFALFAPLKIVGITFNRKTLKSAVASWFSLKPETRKSFDFIADSTCTNESGFDFFVREFLSLGHMPNHHLEDANQDVASQAEKPAQETKMPPAD